MVVSLASTYNLLTSDISYNRSLRAYRILAFKYVLEQQMHGDAAWRATDSALLLTAAAPWFINGLHSTPDNGPASRDLMGKILPLVNRTDADAETLLYPTSTRIRTAAAQNHTLFEEEEEGDTDDELAREGQVIADHEPEDNMSVISDLSDTARPVAEHRHERRTNRQEMLPYVPYGIVFLRPIRIGKGVNMPRFHDSTVAMIAWKTFKYIFGIRRDNVDSEFFKAKLVVKYHPTRVANRVRQTPVHAPDHPAPTIFNLSERGYTLESPVADTGSDVDDLRDEIQDRRGDEDQSIDAQLTSLWNQFLLDLTLKAPNRKSSTEMSYCVLTREERLNVTEATYQNMHLSDYFDDCQYRIGSKDLWQSAFDKFWPLNPIIVAGTQNLPSMRYFNSWAILVDRLREADQDSTIVEMRKVLRARFLGLGWIPHVTSAHVWWTKRDKRLYKKFPSTDYGKPAPRVLIRWDREPTF